MARLGMDADLVESIGQQLKTQASQIDAVISAIDNLINEAIGAWDGPDAQEFHGWWTNQHRPALTNAQHAVDGLGQAAINNAGEQRNVSSH